MSIALLGTGLLGSAIGSRLLERGHRLTVWNRSLQRCEALAAAGATVAASPAEAAQQATWLITVLSDGPTTAAVLLDQVGPALAGRRVLQMGTIGSGESVALAAAVAARGGRYLEAPVLGSRPEALSGSLQLMAGGPRDLLEEALPLLRHLAPEPLHLGEVGSAMATKLAQNQLIASLTHAFSLSLHLVQQQGVDPQAFMGCCAAAPCMPPRSTKNSSGSSAGTTPTPTSPRRTCARIWPCSCGKPKPAA